MAGKQNPHELTVACEICDATGLIPDPTDPACGVICIQCGGQAHRVLAYHPFTGRRSRPGIKRVRRSGQGISAFSEAPSPDAGVTYAEFLKGKQP